MTPPLAALRLPQSRQDHAIGLTIIATYLLLTQPGPLAAHRHLTVAQFPGERGVQIWDARTGRCVLRVGSWGQVWHYQPGPWEQDLVRLIPGIADDAPVRLLLTVPAHVLQAARTWARQTPKTAGPMNPVERLGALALHAAEEG